MILYCIMVGSYKGKEMSVTRNRKEDKKVTQADVANVAGVSSATVSSAMNNRKTVSPITRDRVIKIALEMGYEPNASFYRYMSTIVAEQNRIDGNRISVMKLENPEAAKLYDKVKTERGGLSQIKLAQELHSRFDISKVDAARIITLILYVREIAVTYKRAQFAKSLLRGGRVIIANDKDSMNLGDAITDRKIHGRVPVVNTGKKSVASKSARK